MKINSTCQNLWDRTKLLLKEKHKALNSYIRKGECFFIPINLIAQIKLFKRFKLIKLTQVEKDNLNSPVSIILKPICS